MTSETRFNPLQFIVDGITNRDAPALYGLDPKRDLYRLWADKVELIDSVEPDPELFLGPARALFGVGDEIRFVENPALSFLRAEVNADILRSGSVVSFAVVSRGEFEASKSGHIPERYSVDLQHQLVVTGKDVGIFVATVDGNQINAVGVERNQNFIVGHVEKCIRFWDSVRRGVPPEGAVIPKEEMPETTENQLNLETRPITGLNAEEEHA